MNLEIKKEVLLHFLLQIQKILPQKTFFPVFNYIKLEISQDVFFLEVLNMNISVRIKIQDNSLKVKQNGSLVIVGKYFIDIIKKIDSVFIQIASIENRLLVIKTASSEYKLKIMNSCDFPSIDFVVDVNNVFMIRSNFFKRLIKETNIVTSKDKQQKILTGVNLFYQKPFLKAFATDSFRLSKKEIELNLNYSNFNIVIAHKNLEELNKLLEYQKDEFLKISVNNQRFILYCDSLIFQTSLLEGDYPLLPEIKMQQFPFFIKLNKEDLIKTLERLSLFLPKEENVFSNIIEIKIVNQQMIEISANSDEIGNAVERITPLKSSIKEGVKISLNVKHLEEILKVFPAKEIKILFQNGSNPFIIHNEEEKTLLYLILPFFPI
ncbi:MAG: DNA polymerase III subunit beta [Weeping tea tree witches'-broom phytoplasma]|uniref:DNA polymerase III subunit beta n=1 Tax=Candidatus Phytoplasma melaleucae TaxID=2982630 RepID=UPI00293B4DA4|nr:DNA polymerase III subunit beta [Weeping tea tree witches'-broom phytoplasma]